MAKKQKEEVIEEITDIKTPNKEETKVTEKVSEDQKLKTQKPSIKRTSKEDDIVKIDFSKIKKDDDIKEDVTATNEQPKEEKPKAKKTKKRSKAAA